MVTNEKLDSSYLAITELTLEINSIVRKSFEKGHKELSLSDVEHILKIISDVACKIRPQFKKLPM